MEIFISIGHDFYIDVGHRINCVPGIAHHTGHKHPKDEIYYQVESYSYLQQLS